MSVKLEINTEAHNMMQALGISKERCKDLCGLIDRLIKDRKNINLAEVLKEASMHCENQNELTFLSYILGTHVGEKTGVIKEKLGSALEGLFERLQRTHSKKETFNWN